MTNAGMSAAPRRSRTTVSSKVRTLAPESRERGRAHVSNVGPDAALELRRELTGGRLDPDDPQGGPDGCVAGSARDVRRWREADRDATPHVEVVALGKGEAHRDLIEATREPAVQQLEPVDAGPDRRLAEDDARPARPPGGTSSRPSPPGGDA